MTNLNIGYSYICQSPKPLYGQDILTLNLKGCTTKDQMSGASVGAVLDIIAFLAFKNSAAVYRFRWHLRYLFFLIRARRKKYKEMNEDDFRYDAFISFN